MLIEFALPSGAGGMVASLARSRLQRLIQIWAQRHGISYTEKTVRYTHRLCFDDDRYYTLFMMSWTYWDHFEPRVIRERNKE
jgi:hypothetical protein